jgi:L-rhamnose mutarotase
MGVRSKVKMTPDIRDYINSELNKYTDGSSLPTPEQIEQLSKIVGNNTAEELAKIPNLLNNFKDNTQSYMDFHKSYEEQLEEILRTKFDAEKGANLEIQERNATRLARLREEVRKYADITATTTSASADNSLSYGSLRNIGNGTMLNFNKTADSDYVMLNMIGEKMVKDGNSYQGDEHGEIQGCLTFDSTNKKLGTPALAPCNIDNDTSPELSFNVRKIENIKEYNKLLTETAPETKSLASEYDTINYPFHVVEPQNLYGFCVSVDDNKVRVLPCEKNSNQRYRKMNYQVKNDCGQNNNGTQS